MTNIAISSQGLQTHQAECLALFVEQDFAHDGAVKHLAESYYPQLAAVLKKHDFTGKAGSVFTVSGANNAAVVDLMFVGLGSKKAGLIEIEQYRRALGKLIRTVEARKGTSLALQLPDAALFGVTDKELAQETTIIAHMAMYHFDAYFTSPDAKHKKIETITLVLDGHDEKAVQKGVHEGNIIAKGVNTCRHWIDLPPHRLTPIDLSDKARDIAQRYGLKITVFPEQEIRAMGMGGLAAVSAGSDQDCQLVVMEYTGKPGAPTLGIVGKGITFDSGGLSLKPAASMETMKEDMSGAAAVITTMKIIAQLKPAINVVALTPLSENLPSGKAIKPGDIVTFYNGKTAEIKNTDAEGRLILADALSYAVKHYKLDAMIDLATLTGACAYALGPFFSGLMTQHEDLSARIEQCARKTGDRVWPLPFHDDYKKAIRSSVADICNIGSKQYMAGAITAGFFLHEFVGDVPWAHLDIAGTAFNVPDISYYRSENATGVGVRLLTELIMNWENN